jgi:hypothetical protein|tara:strand:- start:228 stop:542 length:315 start_codon:yes stop_codon:yes gene_type:complete
MDGMDAIAQAVSDFGFPIIMSFGMGYFIYFVWKYITDQLEPEIETMHYALIKCIDANRMLDNDMIRLQQKVKVVLEYRERQEIIEDAKEKEALATVQDVKKSKK